jgi:hypothetical protein
LCEQKIGTSSYVFIFVSLQNLPSFETVLLKTKRKYVYLSCPTTVLKSKMNVFY